MLFLGESDHRRFPLLSSRFTVRRSQFAVRSSPFAVASCHPIGHIGRISPIGELLTCIESAENDAHTQPQTVNCEPRTVNL
jgi:hypothetical protein